MQCLLENLNYKKQIKIYKIAIGKTINVAPSVVSIDPPIDSSLRFCLYSTYMYRYIVYTYTIMHIPCRYS